MRELGYIPQPPDPAKNPDGLPIGFAKDDNPDTVDPSSHQQHPDEDRRVVDERRKETSLP